VWRLTKILRKTLNDIIILLSFITRYTYIFKLQNNNFTIKKSRIRVKISEHNIIILLCIYLYRYINIGETQFCLSYTGIFK